MQSLRSCHLQGCEPGRFGAVESLRVVKALGGMSPPLGHFWFFLGGRNNLALMEQMN